MCKFNEAWIGICNKESIKEEDYCEKHLNTKCEICGNQATHNCSETMQFVCGINLCDSLDCKLEHYYKMHGYAFYEISDLEKELGIVSKIVVTILQYKKSSKYRDWFNEKYKDTLQVARVVYKKDGTVKVFKTNYMYKTKDKSNISKLFEGTFNYDYIKEKGILYTKEPLFLDNTYLPDEIPIFEKIELN